MTKRNFLRMVLAVSLLFLAQLIGGIGCQGGESESGSPIATVWEVLYSPVKWLGEHIGYRGGSASSPLVATANEAVDAHIKWLDEQKFEEPEPLAPLDVDLGSVESEEIRIGREGGNAAFGDTQAGVGMGGMGGGGMGGGIGGGGGG